MPIRKAIQRAETDRAKPYGGAQRVVRPGEAARQPLQRNRDDDRKCGHADQRADAEERKVGERKEKRVDLSRRQQDQRRRPRETMHQSDRECTHGQAARVHMVMARCGVIGIAGVAVCMEVRRAIAVTVQVEVNTRRDQAPQQVGPQQHQHDADGKLEEVRDALGHDAVEREHHGARSEEGQRVPQPPGRTEAKGATQIPAARRQRGDGGDVVRFQRMTHADQEAENENATHGQPPSARRR